MVESVDFKNNVINVIRNLMVNYFKTCTERHDMINQERLLPLKASLKFTGLIQLHQYAAFRGVYDITIYFSIKKLLTSRISCMTPT